MGFLNPAQDDQARIDAMPGTTDVPLASGFDGLASAVPRGVVGGLAKVGQLANDLGESYAANDLAMPDSFRASLDLSHEREHYAAATKIASDWAATGSDPRETGQTGRIVAGTAEGITIAAGGAAVAGPWGAAGLLGSTEGYSSYLQGKADGLDDTTAKEQALLVGGFSAASAFLPMKFGKSLATSIIGGSAANVGLGMAQRGLTSEVLQANGYHDMAKQYRVFDGEAMAADVILGGAFGAMGHFVHPAGTKAPDVNPADVDAAAAVASEDHFNRSAPGVPTDAATATLHADTMAGALHDLANGDLPTIEPERAQQLVDNVLPDPMHGLDSPPAAVQPTVYDINETRGSDARFHGTSRPLPGDAPNNEYAMSGDNRNIFGQGFYTTDAADVASGYMKKGGAGEPTLYSIKEKPGTKLFDMEAPLTPEVKAIARDVFGELMPEVDINDHPIENLRSMYNEFRAESRNNDLSRDDVQEIFDGFRYRLEQLGYHGFRHTGAINSAKYAPHDVRIYWTPEDHISVSRDSIDNYRTARPPVAGSSPLQEAAHEDLPGYAAAAADVPRMELPPEEVPPPKPEPAPLAEGETPPVPLDDFHGEMLDHLVHNYGDAPYTTEDGRQTTYREMANEMQAQRNEADHFAKLHDIAAACAARNGA